MLLCIDGRDGSTSFPLPVRIEIDMLSLYQNP